MPKIIKLITKKARASSDQERPDKHELTRARAIERSREHRLADAVDSLAAIANSLATTYVNGNQEYLRELTRLNQNLIDLEQTVGTALGTVAEKLKYFENLRGDFERAFFSELHELVGDVARLRDRLKT